MNDFKAELNLDIKIKYIPTELNPSDLLTRGLKTEEFIKNLKFWQNGPDFICKNKIVWPERELGCLSKESKNI